MRKLLSTCLDCMEEDVLCQSGFSRGNKPLQVHFKQKRILYKKLGTYQNAGKTGAVVVSGLPVELLNLRSACHNDDPEVERPWLLLQTSFKIQKHTGKPSFECMIHLLSLSALISLKTLLPSKREQQENAFLFISIIQISLKSI